MFFRTSFFVFALVFIFVFVNNFRFSFLTLISSSISFSIWISFSFSVLISVFELVFVNGGRGYISACVLARSGGGSDGRGRCRVFISDGGGVLFLPAGASTVPQHRHHPPHTVVRA